MLVQQGKCAFHSSGEEALKLVKHKQKNEENQLESRSGVCKIAGKLDD